jgi:histone acetyltransferase MYST1
MTVTVESSPRIDVSPSAPSTPEREHAELTKVRNFEDVRFGEFLIKTW